MVLLNNAYKLEKREETHGGFGYGSRNADGSRILEFADGLNLVICNTQFTKQEAKLVT